MAWELLNAVLLLVGLASLLGAGTALLSLWVEKQPPRDSVVERVNALLPQIQCAQCGYPGCQPYAQAILEGERLDLCPPGGVATAGALAELLNRPVKLPSEPVTLTSVAVIEEKECVGCALCLKACPVDAIVGANLYMHTVVQEHCTGCELCVPVCPVDCIDMVKTLDDA